jgi:hypothetical protein
VKQTEKVGHIAVQRAYANWSDPRLAILRGEISELGIDPIQVFGFSRDQKKNAADLQLAIDAIDLAHVRPALEVFVIVSGDGGFAALAKKLHEYGKTVIGCAYRNATNRTFQAVCDDFVWIEDPEGDEGQDSHVLSTFVRNRIEVSDQRNVRLTSKISRTTSASLNAALSKTREVLDWYASDPISRSDLIRKGIHLSVIREAIGYAIPNFLPSRYGFPKFLEYLQFACKGTQLCVVIPPDSHVVLALREKIISGSELLPDIDLDNLHSVDRYRSLLATGSPMFRLPLPTDLQEVARCLVNNPPYQADLGTIIENVTRDLDRFVSSEVVKLAVLALVSADAFERAPEGAAISEQTLNLRREFYSLPALIGILRNAARSKLAECLTEVRDDVLFELLPQIH